MEESVITLGNELKILEEKVEGVAGT